MSTQSNGDIKKSVYSVVSAGKLDKAMELIDEYELTNSEEGYVLLCDAIKERNTAVAKILLSKGLRVGSSIDNIICCNNALHFAARYGDIEIVEILLNKGAYIDSKNEDGRTPLHCVIEGIFEKETKEKLVNILLEKGANVDSQCNKGYTPLHLAAKEGYEEIVKALLENDANIGAYTCVHSTFEQKSALNLAYERGHFRVVITLLNYGADVTDDDLYNTVSFRDQCLRDFDALVFDLHNRVLKYHALKMAILNLPSLDLDDKSSKLVFKSKVSSSHILFDIDCVKSLLSKLYYEEIDADFTSCKEDITKMKHETIINSNVSFYDILAKGMNSLVTYLKNENVVQELQSDTYKTKFPIYADILEINFRRGMKRKELLEQLDINIHFLFNKLLPHICIAEIYSYLNNKDLNILLKACELLPQ